MNSYQLLIMSTLSSYSVV